MKAKQEVNKKTNVLIVGLGNSLAGDDGFGPYMVNYLNTSPLPYGVKAIEGGTNAFALLPELEKAEHVIILDVIQTGEEPGTIYRIPLSSLASGRRGFSQHDISLLTLYQLPFSKWHLNLPDGVLYAVEVGEIEVFCEKLNPRLIELAPVLEERLRGDIKDWIGVELYRLD